MDYREIETMLLGQWEEVLTMYGIDVPKWQGKNTRNYPCPCCGGDDRAHWRETDGRLSLYCRNCASDKMKSVEDVLMECTGLSFHSLVLELASFLSITPTEKITQAKAIANSKPKYNMPQTHKQDHKKSMAVLEQCELMPSNHILLSHGAQYPHDVNTFNGYPVMPIVNDENIIINAATVTLDKEIRFAAGGLSYGGAHIIQPCEIRNTGKVMYCCDIFESIKQWYKKGHEIRCVFDIYNLIWMMKKGLLVDGAELALSEEEKPLV